MDVDPEHYLLDYLRTLPKLNRVDAKIVLGDLYDKTYGIFDHTSVQNRRPLSSVAFHPAEMVNEDSLLEEGMRLYISRNIYEHFKLSWTEFMDLPRDIAQSMLRIADEYNDLKRQSMGQLEQELSNLNKS